MKADGIIAQTSLYDGMLSPVLGIFICILTNEMHKIAEVIAVRLPPCWGASRIHPLEPDICAPYSLVCSSIAMGESFESTDSSMVPNSLSKSMGVRCL